MIRTIIGLEPEDKQWLEQQAKFRKTSIASLIRQAVRRMRQEVEIETPAFDTLLERTQGVWTQGDGLAYQQALREDW
ncbi:MAG: hypothetical protein ACFB0C_04040 [Leptolyngbyaceae cyanobacterium]